MAGKFSVVKLPAFTVSPVPPYGAKLQGAKRYGGKAPYTPLDATKLRFFCRAKRIDSTGWHGVAWRGMA